MLAEIYLYRLLGHSPAGSYNRIVPTYDLALPTAGDDEQPPSLPPHLLNVILNKETEQVIIVFLYLSVY